MKNDSNLDLKASWEITTRYLNSAYKLIPEKKHKSDDLINAEIDYREYLNHNELELALDSLEFIGESNSVPIQFWENLLKAAINMELEDHKNIYINKIEENKKYV